MFSRSLVAAAVCFIGTPALAQSNAPALEGLQTMLVLDIRAVGDVGEDRARVLTDLLVSHLRSANKYKVMGSQDVVSIIGANEQAQLAGCDDDSCMAEIAGALNAPWLVSGNLGLLGNDYVLTLKMIDSTQAELSNQLSQSLPETDSELPRAMEVIAYSLLGLKAPELPGWYTKWWVWAIAGTVVVAGIATGLAVALQPSTQTGNLGQVTF